MKWANNEIIIESIPLNAILQTILDSFHYFKWLSFKHIFRELNAQADDLSKEPLE